MKRLSALALVILISGCSSSPSNSDVQKAVQAEFAEMNKMTTEMGMGGSSQLHSAKSLGCKKSTEGQGYICDVEMDVTIGLLGRKTSVSPVRFIKTDNGWRAVDEIR